MYHVNKIFKIDAIIKLLLNKFTDDDNTFNCWWSSVGFPGRFLWLHTEITNITMYNNTECSLCRALQPIT